MSWNYEWKMSPMVLIPFGILAVALFAVGHEFIGAVIAGIVLLFVVIYYLEDRTGGR
jgi:hypothetical protein